jgi:hypothetical protein
MNITGINYKLLNKIKLFNLNKNIIYFKFIYLSLVLIIIDFGFASEIYCRDYNCITVKKIIDIKKKNREKLLEDSIRPILQHSTASPKNFFRIHYNTTGSDSVDNVDIDNNGIPDYIDSVAYYFDYAYEIEVNKLGYIHPLTDSMRGGDDLYDIYVHELIYESTDASIYGWTEVEDIIIVNDSLHKYSSFIYIDNNYSTKDSITYANGRKAPAYKTSGINGMKITAAHEFHHAIQFSYLKPETAVNELMEMTSTWIESCVYPEIDDYFQYLPELFQKINEFPITNVGDGTNGYRWSIFLHYLSKMYGNDIVRNIWENLEKENEIFSSINVSLKKHNSVLSKTWCDFVPWLYFTSYRSLDTTLFSNASKYPKIQMVFTEALLNTDLQITETILPFQILPYRIRNQSGVSNNIQVIDFLITSSFDYLNEKNIEPSALNLQISSTEKYQNKIEFSNSISYQLNGSNTNGDLCTGVFINDGINYSYDSYVMPNPVNINQDNINIVLPLDTPGKDYEVSVYDSKMNTVFFNIIKIGRYNGMNCLSIVNSEVFTNGIYFYNVIFNEQSFFGKFAIIKN